MRFPPMLRRQGKAARGTANVERTDLGEKDSASLNIVAATDHYAPSPVADEDVFGDVQVGKQQRLLIDRGDPHPLRLRGARDRDGPAGSQIGRDRADARQ